jgi:methionyl-tRNA formyltransferase
MRLIFMGTPEVAVPTLEALIGHGYDVAAVFTQPDRPVGRHQTLTPPPVKQVAEQHGLKIYQPEKIKTDEVREAFRALAPDAVVVAAYGKILPAWLLEVPRLGCINVHFSLLPKYRGAAPVNWTIVRGETETGVTTMMMDPGLDTGPILLQQRCDIRPDETAPELAEKLSKIGAALLIETLEKLERGQITPQEQDHAQSTLAPILKREDGLIDWTWAASDIRNRVRGFQPWPGAWTTLDGHRLHLWRARVISDAPPSDALSGTISQFLKDAIVVMCGNGLALGIEELQLEGKRRLTAREFLNGARLTVGQRLGSGW